MITRLNERVTDLSSVAKAVNQLIDKENEREIAKEMDKVRSTMTNEEKLKGAAEWTKEQPKKKRKRKTKKND